MEIKRFGGYVDMLSNGEINLRTKPINGSGEKLVLRDEPDNVDRVWLLSIRHSGTHYMYQYMEACGYERCIVHWEIYTQKHPTGQKQYLHAHLEVGHEYENDLTCEKCVMPLRNPTEVYKSHLYRYNWKISQYVPYILNAFERFQTVISTHRTHLFQVDAEDQELEFDRLSEFLESPGIYKEQPRNINTAVGRNPTTQEDILFANGKMDPERNHAYDNPPQEIVELARQFGY